MRDLAEKGTLLQFRKRFPGSLGLILIPLKLIIFEYSLFVLL